jgi:hypothetical protein
MTIEELTDAVRELGPIWTRVFDRDEVNKALRKAKAEAGCDAYVQLPRNQINKVVSQAAVWLNRWHPEKMAKAIDAQMGRSDE